MFWVVPAIVIWITPAQLHMHLHVFCKPGIPRTSTVGEPGAQGAAITGTQGMGVKTPRAAVVAAATVGLASELHIPNGGIFMMGTLSMIFAAGGPCPSTVGTATTRVLGATPKALSLVVNTVPALINIPPL